MAGNVSGYGRPAIEKDSRAAKNSMRGKISSVQFGFPSGVSTSWKKTDRKWLTRTFGDFRDQAHVSGISSVRDKFVDSAFRTRERRLMGSGEEMLRSIP
jgi:hypothetical protein